MVKVYLDNNILVSLQEGAITLPMDSVSYYGSFAHFKELKESGVKLDTLKNERIKLLQTITNGRFLVNNNETPFDPPSIIEVFCDYHVAFESILDDKFGIENTIKQIHKTEWISKAREILRAHGLVNPVVTNNYTPERLIKEYLSLFDEYINETAGDNRYAAFQSLFNILEMIGYHRDKKTEFHANVSRSYDAEHAYYASCCDYFVTEDKGCRMKSNLAYSYWKYKTKSVCLNDFLIIQGTVGKC